MTSTFGLMDILPDLYEPIIQLQQKTLELQLSDLKLQQQEEKSAKEQTQMQLYAEQVSQLLSTERSLRVQLAADEERFQQFQVYTFKV